MKSLDLDHECLNLSDPVLDDLECGYKDCLTCSKRWFLCGFCDMDDFETEEELVEHLEKRHPQQICEHPASERSGRLFNICDACGYEFDDNRGDN